MLVCHRFAPIGSFSTRPCFPMMVFGDHERFVAIAVRYFALYQWGGILSDVYHTILDLVDVPPSPPLDLV